MKKAILLFLLLVSPASGQTLAPSSDPFYAVVRIKSHGVSGTIIKTDSQRSYILSCAHMFFTRGTENIDQSLLKKKLFIEGPNQPYARQGLFDVKVVGVDAKADLSLLVIENGPFNYIPVAPSGFRPGRNLSSAGYDNMTWPITQKPATILYFHGAWTYTKEKPWHGRSGGGLFDLDAKVLIGVVNGYEVGGQEKGIYASHEGILRFLTSLGLGPVAMRPPAPRPMTYVSPVMPQFGMPQPCPGGA